MPSLKQRLREGRTAPRSPVLTKETKGTTEFSKFKEEMKAEIEPWVNTIVEQMIKKKLKGDLGDPGEPGKDGVTPQKGVDYLNEEDLAEIERKTAVMIDTTADELRKELTVKPPVIPKAEDMVLEIMSKIPMPKDADEKGMMKRLLKLIPKIMTAKGIVKMLETLPEKEKLDFYKALRNQPNGHQYGQRTLHRGGGTTSFSFLTATGTIDDSNTTFTFAESPSAVIVNGAVYEDGNNVTITGLTAELDNAVGENGSIVGIK